MLCTMISIVTVAERKNLEMWLEGEGFRVQGFLQEGMVHHLYVSICSQQPKRAGADMMFDTM